MRILLIHQVFVTPDKGGGTRHYEMCRHLAIEGHQVEVIASEIDYLSGKKIGAAFEEREGIRIYYLKNYSRIHKNIFHRALGFFSFSLLALWKGLHLKNVNVIWATSPPLFQAFTSLLLAKIKGVPLVFEVRDLWLDFARELKIVTNPLIFFIFKIIERLIYWQATAVVVNSPGFNPYVRKKIPSRKLTVFPNGVELTDFLEIPPEKVTQLKAEFRLGDQFVVLYAGNLGVANDIETILHAAEILNSTHPKITFVFLGGGMKVEEYQFYCSENKLKNVRFFSPQPKKKMPQILSMADVCLATLKDIPLFNTTYPNKVFDYMAAGRPTILGIDGAIRDVVEKSCGGTFVPPGDAVALARAVLLYYNNPAIGVKQGKSAKSYVFQHFDREEISREFSRFLEQVLRNKFQEN